MTGNRNSTDPSGLYPFETFETLFKYEIARALRYPSALTLLNISLDIQGNPLQDRERAGQIMTDLLNKSLRISDVPTQHNDEFLVLLPATDEQGARTVADRILGRFRNTQQLPAGGLFRMNAFIGIASQHGDQPISAEQLMGEAAAAMQEARAQGARTTVAFSEIALKMKKSM